MSRSYSSLLSWFALTIAASLMLYHTSDRVTALNQQLNTLNAQIDAEQQSLHVLKAEWVYLANPERVDAAARRHLALQPTSPQHVVAMKNIGSLLPLHDGVEPAPQIQTAEAAPPARPSDVATATVPVKQATALAVQGKSGHVIALNSGHINEHMILQHTAAVEASNDGLGALINSLSLRP